MVIRQAEVAVLPDAVVADERVGAAEVRGGDDRRVGQLQPGAGSDHGGSNRRRLVERHDDQIGNRVDLVAHSVQLERVSVPRRDHERFSQRNGRDERARSSLGQKRPEQRGVGHAPVEKQDQRGRVEGERAASLPCLGIQASDESSCAK